MKISMLSNRYEMPIVIVIGLALSSLSLAADSPTTAPPIDNHRTTHTPEGLDDHLAPDGVLEETHALLSTLPQDYVESTVIGGASGVPGINRPIDLAFDPDGGLWVLNQTGVAYVLRGGTLEEALFLPVSSRGDSGLMTITIDPDYATNKHVWLFYTTPLGNQNRLSRFTNVNDRLIDEEIVFSVTNRSEAYNGGCHAIGAGGQHYIGTAFDGDPIAAGDPFSRIATVIRMDSDGEPWPGNPFIDGVAADPLVYAFGFRNPFRCAVQPSTGELFVSDVGYMTWEELNVISAGAHYGWPICEGPDTKESAATPTPQPCPPGYAAPEHYHNHDNFAAAATSVAFAEAGDLAPGDAGKAFFADFNQRTIFRATMNGSAIDSVEVFATQVIGNASHQFGPDGALYYVSWQFDQVRKIEYTGP